jgi:hypothetical protein
MNPRPSRSIRICLAWSAIMLLTPRSAFSSQAPVSISSAVTCATCTVSVAKVVTLGRPDDPVTPAPAGGIVRDRQGRFYTPVFTGDAIVVYGPDGAYMRTLGRRGQGPGEYQEITSITMDARGQIYVFDHTRRITVLDTALRVVRTVVPEILNGRPLLMSDGTFVESGGAPGPGRTGVPLHLLSSDGRWLRSFGGEAGVVTPVYGIALVRQLAAARSGGVWSARLDRYEMEEWDLAGKRRRALRRRADWFYPTPGEETWARGALFPQLAGIREDERGRLWTIARVPTRPTRPQATSEGSGPARLDASYQTVLEILDPTRGVVVARTRVPGGLRGFVMTDHAYRVVEDNDGNLSLEVFQVRFVP